MKKIDVYDPPMCCSSGVCGPSVDTKLVEIQGVLSALKAKGLEVNRYNLGHQPDKFANNQEVLKAMGDAGENLPIIMIDDKICFKGGYPSKEELYQALGVKIESTNIKSLKVL
jgi:hypothetical protein